jgi:exodeoxyribonuclease V alpha subunit
VRILGPRTASTLETNPYVLAKTLPWRRMDAIGLKLLGARLGAEEAKHARQRLLGAVDSAVGEWLGYGHTAITQTKLRALLRRRLGKDELALIYAENLGERHARLADDADDGERRRFPGCAFLERRVADKLAAISRSTGAIALEPADADRLLADVLPFLPRPLSDEQAAAVRHALCNSFAVVAGGAGTGKTATMQALVLAREAAGGNVHLCALAGKADLRLSQATHRLARTIHRTLAELSLRASAEDKRSREEWTKLDDRTLIIVDEASMVDLGQWARLLDAIPPGCRLCMVGNTAQLPPIGFGVVFHLLAQRADTATLTRIFRQKSESDIPIVADDVRHGRHPTLKPFRGRADGVSLVACESDELTNRIMDTAQAMGGFDDDGLRIVAATNTMVRALNHGFHAIRTRGRDEVKGYLGAYFGVGDPVVHLDNDYRKGLFNGMLGVVTAVDIYARAVEAAFEGVIHRFVRDDLIHLDLAYALTCHKLQGSQAARVIIAIEKTILLEPSWLYTAITRAERQAVLVGNPDHLRTGVSRQPAWAEREVGFAFPASEMRCRSEWLLL